MTIKKSNCLIIAGELSGENHGMSFLQELKSLRPDLNFFGVGGEKFKKHNVDLVYHLKEFSTFGISQAIVKIKFYFKAMKEILFEVDRRSCQYAILIDYQTFNLKLAEKLSKKGVKVFYYVAPQAWAWKSYRTKALSRYLNTLFTIIPFEKKWFEERGVKNVISVAHPLLSEFKEETYTFKKSIQKLKGKVVKVLLLPGSRKDEVHSMLKLFIETIRDLKRSGIKFEVGIVKSSNIKPELYNQYLDWVDHEYENQEIAIALKSYDLSFAASGTVTLQCALFQLPTIVCYKLNLFNEFIVDTFIKYKGFASLANIVHEKEVFPELLLERANTYNLKNQFLNWYNDFYLFEQVVKDLEKTKDLLKNENFNVAKYLAENMVG